MQMKGSRRRHGSNKKLTLWLREVALLHARADGFVHLRIEDIEVGCNGLVIGKNVLLDGGAATRKQLVSAEARR